MKTLFYISLKKINKKGFAPIYCRITINGKRCEISTGFFINPVDWKNENLVATTKENVLQNMALSKIKADINIIYCDLILKDKSVSADIVKDLYIGTAKYNHTFLEMVNEYVEYKFKNFKEYNTLKNYRSRKALIQGFLKEVKRINIMPEDFKLKQAELYIDYLTDKKLQKSYINRQITFLKAAFNFGVRMDILKLNPIACIELTYDKAKPIIALTKKELLILTTFKFKNKRLQHVADCYVFQSFTGFAYVDLFDFDYTKHTQLINGKLWIVKSRVKSHIEATVPLFADAKRILTKYNYKLPVISNQKYNEYLKEIVILIPEISKPLTTHTARKTFAMVKLNDGFSIESVAKMLGHNSIKVTQSTYAQVNTGRIEAEQIRLGIK